ncbi:hypothetical protein [Akkermansia sp.]|uniref:hypothetical protein n=1 Tax=Akkermansia sp. TaxID=1872421 RepID=UPI0025BCD7BA|nr:hypothetical protein [Akkermansia sp.]
MTAVYQDAEGYTRTVRYTQDDIPADQAPAMQAVVAALVGLSEPWQASQVWARLGHVTALAPADEPFDPAEIEIEAVELTVEAVNALGGRRTFTATDYPELTLTTIPAVAFFKHFTNQ